MSTGGRGVWSRKVRVDEARSIDILDIQRNGLFDEGGTGIWTRKWTRNEEVVASISYCLESGEEGPIGVRFMYTISSRNSEEKKDCDYIIPVVSTPCNFGGKRWWFACPLVINNQFCRRRCRIIYMPPASEYFGCRECYQLTYESRQRHREKFYEGVEKPYIAIEAAQQKLAKARSWEQKEKLWRKLAHAHTAIRNFENCLTRS